MTLDEKKRIRGLAEGRIAPESGMEKHFVNVVNGKGKPCSPREKEWLAYWRSVEATKVSDSDVTLETDGVDRQSETKDVLASVKSSITEIEHRTDLTDEEKVSKITHVACATCAGVAIQPIPFADIFVLTPIQAYFGTRIAAIRGVPVSDSEASDLIKELVGVIGLGVIAQQIALGIWKMVTFGTGGLLTIPLVYGLTFAVMKVMDAYYSAKAKKTTLSDKAIKEIWSQAFKDGKKRASTAKERGELN